MFLERPLQATVLLMLYFLMYGKDVIFLILILLVCTFTKQKLHPMQWFLKWISKYLVVKKLMKFCFHAVPQRKSTHWRFLDVEYGSCSPHSKYFITLGLIDCFYYQLYIDWFAARKWKRKKRTLQKKKFRTYNYSTPTPYDWNTLQPF